MIIFGIIVGASAVALVWLISGVFHKPAEARLSQEELFVQALEKTGLRQINAGTRLRRGEFVVTPLVENHAYRVVKVAPTITWQHSGVSVFVFNHKGQLDSCGTEQMDVK